MKQYRLILVGAAVVAMTACGGDNDSRNPLNPSNTATGALHVGVDRSTCFLLQSVDVSVDGTMVATITPGDAGVTRDVAIGTHNVSGHGITIDRQFQSTWAAAPLQVSAAGFTYTMTCTVNRGYSVTSVE